MISPTHCASAGSSLMQRAIDPVIVAWDGGPYGSSFDCPPLAAMEARYRIDLESGEFFEGKCQRDFRIKPVERCIEGVRYVGQWLSFLKNCPSVTTACISRLARTPSTLIFCHLHCKPTEQQLSTLDSGAFSAPYTPLPPRKLGRRQFCRTGDIDRFHRPNGRRFRGHFAFAFDIS